MAQIVHDADLCDQEFGPDWRHAEGLGSAGSIGSGNSATRIAIGRGALSVPFL